MSTDIENRRDALRERYLRPVGERPASTARGLHHTALVSSDVERTVAFYQDVLGFPLTELIDNRDYPGSSHFFHDIGNGNLLAFFDFPGYEHPEFHETLGGIQHLAISMATEEFVALKERLAAAGVEYRGPDLGVQNSVYVRDPDGLQVELCTAPLMNTDFD